MKNQKLLRFLTLALALTMLLMSFAGCANVKLFGNKKDDEEVNNLFHQGLATMTRDGKKVGYINTKGFFVIDPQFDSALDFQDNGMACIEVNGKWGCIDKKGAYVANPQFDTAFTFSDNGLACVSANGKYGYIDINHERTTMPIYDTPEDAVYYGKNSHDRGFVIQNPYLPVYKVTSMGTLQTLEYGCERLGYETIISEQEGMAYGRLGSTASNGVFTLASRSSMSSSMESITSASTVVKSIITATVSMFL